MPPGGRPNGTQAARDREVVIRLEVDEALPRGLAIYGRHFSRFPVDPTVLLVLP